MIQSELINLSHRVYYGNMGCQVSRGGILLGNIRGFIHQKEEKKWKGY